MSQQITDVGEGTFQTSSSGDSPDTTSSVDTLESGSSTSSQIAGSVTADEGGADAVAQVAQGGTTLPPSEEADPLAGIPSTDELKKQADQKVPYAQALFNLRTAYEARNEEFSQLQTGFQPVQPILDKYGDVETVESRLETLDSLFTPVVNPDTGQTVITAAKFIERIDSDNPGMAYQLLIDSLNHTVDVGDGKQSRLYATPQIQGVMFEALGLDPKRLDDYRNIDALATAPQHTGVTLEELATIPDDRKEAYRTLPASLRAAWGSIDEDEQKYHLDSAHERLETKNWREQQSRQQAETQQQAERQALEYVSSEQNSFVQSQLQESYTSIMDDLASKVAFSGDENSNAVALGTVGAFLLALRDPDQSFATEKTLNALGVKVEPSFYEAIQMADKHMRDYKAYDLVGKKDFARNSLTLANNAKRQAVTKSALIALKIAKALGGVQAAAANEQGRLLQDATTGARPVPGNGASASETNGLLPSGMRANSPEADLHLWRQTQGA
jgi:hypothetical protein